MINAFAIGLEALGLFLSGKEFPFGASELHPHLRSFRGQATNYLPYGRFVPLSVSFPSLLELVLQEFLFCSFSLASQVAMLPEIVGLMSPRGKQMSKGEPQALSRVAPVPYLSNNGERTKDLNRILLSSVPQVPHLFDGACHSFCYTSVLQRGFDWYKVRCSLL